MLGTMTKIERVELFHVAVPLPRPFYPSWIPGYPQLMDKGLRTAREIDRNRRAAGVNGGRS
jgi:hypothetical protein